MARVEVTVTPAGDEDEGSLPQGRVNRGAAAAPGKSRDQRKPSG